MQSGDAGTETTRRGRMDAPLPTLVWLAALVAVAAWITVRIRWAGIATLDRNQQFHLVRTLGRLDIRHAMGGDITQASPPGYGFFALPFHLLLRRIHGAWWSYEVASYASLPVLALAVVVAARALGWPGRSGRELLFVATAVGAGSTVACLTEAMHPTDVLATALVLLCFAALVRGRLGWAVVFLGLGLYTKQWVVVPLAVFAVLHEGRRRGWLALGPIAMTGIGLAPFALFQLHDTFQAFSAPEVVSNHTTLVGYIPMSSSAVRALEARILPLIIVAGFCLWIEQRHVRFSPAVGMAALAVAGLVRPLIDPAGYVYYAAPGVVFLALTARSWRLPVAVLGLTFVLTWTNHPNPHQPTRTEAAITTAVLAVALGLAISQFWRALRASADAADGDPVDGVAITADGTDPAIA